LQIDTRPPEPAPEEAFNADDYADFNPDVFANTSKSHPDLRAPMAAPQNAPMARSPQDMLAQSMPNDAQDFDIEAYIAQNGRIARNAACPCTSGLKFKHCHGKL